MLQSLSVTKFKLNMKQGNNLSLPITIAAVAALALIAWVVISQRASEVVTDVVDGSNALQQNISNVANDAGDALPPVGDVMGDMVDGAHNMADGAGDVMGDMVDGAKDMAGDMVDGAGDAMNDLPPVGEIIVDPALEPISQ